MALMKAVQVSKPGGQFELVERPIPEPARGQVRIRDYEGASDAFTAYPRR
jgi:D-arabinose 1-dehydrogenase-like Zn-dependent alcohol dehydrogenase